jgi:glutamate synthase (NADPH) small chain
MGSPIGFLHYKRETQKDRDPLKRLKDWNEIQHPVNEKKLQKQASRCMDCGTPFCHVGIEIANQTSGCPLHNHIPEWNDLVYKGKWKEALHQLMLTNNFPEFTGRVCPAPCEGSCTAGINGSPVTIKNIEQTIIDKGFEEGWIKPEPPLERTGKCIAVIGSGPAGLACADQLNKAGHYVTVYERDDRIGGLLMYGIPNMKLDKMIVTRRVQLLEQEGINFVTNMELGKDIDLSTLKQKYDAVILCTGAQKHRELQLEGRELHGVIPAMDYLTLNTKSLLDSEHKDNQYINAKGKHVVVIGGGDTGADCVATALRHDCKSVVQFGKHPQLPFERSTNNPWPENPRIFTVDYAHKEAKAKIGEDPRRYSILTKKFVGDAAGNVKELHTVEIKKVFAEDGTFGYQEIQGSEQVWPVDLALIAIGFSGPEDGYIQQEKIAQKNSSTLETDSSFQTNMEGVFAAGDVRRGQSLIVWAIKDGREVAKECDRYLMGETVLP